MKITRGAPAAARLTKKEAAGGRQGVRADPPNSGGHIENLKDRWKLDNNKADEKADVGGTKG